MASGLVYYTCGTHDPVIANACRRRLLAVRGARPIVAVSLVPLDFGDTTIVLELTRGPEAQATQILAGLEASTADVVFLVEGDVLYHPSHFAFIPPRDDAYYYNTHTWKVDSRTGQALFYVCKQVSGLCSNRALLLDHYRKRVARIRRVGHYEHSIGHEPGLHRLPRGLDSVPVEQWMSEVANVDIRHPGTMTKSRWRQDQFRDPTTCLGWTMSDAVTGWGITKGRFTEFLKEHTT